ncbi:hypothetical protein LAT59_04025, partial [Candidatus Gracilibacteria bacterium]|nr:hypothetical protein [Candidatus Gracilibacteria bacterium]
FAEYYRYKITLRDAYGNTIPGKEIFNLRHTCSGQLNCFDIRQNMVGVNPSGVRTLDIFDTELISDSYGDIYFSIRSFAPGRFTESFRFEMYNWDDDYENVSTFTEVLVFGNENSFLKLITGKLQANISGVWEDNLLIGTETQYLLSTQIYNNTISNYTLSDDFDAYITASQSGTQFTLSGSLQREDSDILFTGIFESSLPESQEHLSLLTIDNSGVSPVSVSYVFQGYNISHLLSSHAIHHSPITLGFNDSAIEPVRIIGQSIDIGGDDNDSHHNMSTQNTRNTFRRNIVRGIQGRVHNTTVGGVRYIDGSQLHGNTYTLSGTPNYQTLVVRDANILIESNFNIGGAPIGLIAMKSTGYSVTNKGYEDIGNIYIEPNVSQIHAIMYADGGIISTSGGQALGYNSASRSSILSSQLYIKGSIFSRNTLGGSELRDGVYMLPGSIATQDIDSAVQYDLRHLRRGNSNCVEVSGACRFSNYLIIEYDNRLISSPPPLFSQ